LEGNASLIDELEKPIQNSLFFVGEGTTREFHGFAHGAIFS